MKKWLGFACFMAFTSLLVAQDAKYVVHARLIGVMPNEDSSTIGATGTGIAVDNAVVPEVDLTWMFKDHWGLEIIAATSPHDLSTEKGALAGADAGKVWALPPTLTLQYHTGTDEKIDFYAGLGLNYTLFYSYDLSDDLDSLGVTDVEFSNSFGLAANLGLDFKISDKWTFNMDLKYIDMSTDAELKIAGGATLAEVTVDLNPIVAGIGVGYRF